MKILTASILGAAALGLVAALPAHGGDTRTEAIATLKRDFKPRGIATLDRLDEDGVQAICNRTHDSPPKEIAQRLAKEVQALERYVAGRADVFDACLCLVAAKDFIEGRALPPQDLELAQREGWIWVRAG